MSIKKMGILNEYLLDLDIHLSDEQLSQFYEYFNVLIEWNKVMNLTGITEFEEVVIKHFVDSLCISKAINMNSVDSIIDIGTGAGFPGIPLKIAFPKINIVLLDSLNKRIKFLNRVIDTLDLKDIKCIHGRAEDFSREQDYRENFDLCVSRAVANLSSLSEYCLPFVKKGGSFISYKSGKIEAELKEANKAIFILGGKLKDEVKFSIPKTDMERSLVVIEKVKKTPGVYPRKAGIPTREPLK